MAIIPWNKKYTETLAVSLQRFRIENPQYRDSKITYAGRLDPMAEGLVVLLTNNDVHKKQEFLIHDKTYRVEFIFGIATDSYDILGLITRYDESSDLSTAKIHAALCVIGKITQQEYPIYSSKTVSGKPLWQWAREGLVDTITIPSRNIEISDIKYIGKRISGKQEFTPYIQKTIAQVEGDFRQLAILSSWERYFQESDRAQYTIHNIEVSASSGTYIRSLIQTLGQHLGTSAVSIKITRIRVGKYHLKEIDKSIDK